MKRLDALSPRERVLLLAVLPLALVFGAWRFGWLPLTEARADLTKDIATYRLIMETIAVAGERPVAIDRGAATPLARRVTESAAAAGLSLNRLEPDGDALRVTIAEAPFAQVILWLDDLEIAQGVALAAIELDRRSQPGDVTARILLGDAR